ncbi:uncharacterized protein LOC112272366 [Brachypodium distachyon]|uniref:Uncharacterized protein n=1 Tax=Brachypodium distachyon TaxID=15368 RepID=I1ING3_BRADI|nr:uncharacterized protein LOC112272366 [Brachypodium distachyon]KQJ89402.1 hypothetical protein BRADI_4g25447v3 [Brachypodium distachyon]|eukprot:XP_024318714.1 uncharacterized protein LOC112272366 [Brachypodium distachyon]
MASLSDGLAVSLLPPEINLPLRLPRSPRFRQAAATVLGPLDPQEQRDEDEEHQQTVAVKKVVENKLVEVKEEIILENEDRQPAFVEVQKKKKKANREMVKEMKA